MILCVNAGSSSINLALYDESAKLVKKVRAKNLSAKTGYRLHINKLVSELNLGNNLPNYIVFRVVLAGEGRLDGEIISKNIEKEIKKHLTLAPLHNKPCLEAISYFRKKYPKSKLAAVYDTALYNNLPDVEKVIPINRAKINRLKIKKYGFHGISHRYAYDTACANRYEKVVTIHLGAGCSASAFLKGEILATSMSFTPNSGLIMQTRSGEIDPGIVLYLVNSVGYLNAKQIIEHESGIKGITGGGGDMLDTLYAAGYPIEDEEYLKKIGNKNKSISQFSKNISKLAIETYCQSIKKQIGAFAAIMGGLDLIVFTGHIGHGSKFLRDKITYGLDYLHLKEVISVKTDEEQFMANVVLNKYY